MEGFDPGLVYFYLTLPPGSDTDVIEGRLLEELGRVTSEGITEAELQKARNIMIADHWRDLSTISGKAAALGRAEVSTVITSWRFPCPMSLPRLRPHKFVRWPLTSSTGIA